MAKDTVRPQVNVPMSEAQKKHLDEWCKKNGTPAASLGRKLFADHTNYDLSQEPEPIRGNRKYATVEERIAAQAKRMKERNDLVKKLLAEHRDKAEKAQASKARDNLRK